MSEDAFGVGGSKQAAGCMGEVGESQTNAPTGNGSMKTKKPRKPRSETNRENYLRRMSRDMPVKIWLSPEAFEVFESGRKTKSMSRSQYGNELFGKGAGSPSKDSGASTEGPVSEHPKASLLMGSVGGADEPTVSLLSDGARKQLDRLARYSKGAGRVLSEGEILTSLVNGVSPDMLVWMLKIATQRNEALVDVFRSELSLAKTERAKTSVAAEERNIQPPRDENFKRILAC